MNNQSLAISEVLRFANHDYVNQLQLIRMNLDLGRVEHSKELITQYCEQLRVCSTLNHLRLPQTVEWLQTARWRYPSFTWNVYCDGAKPVVNVIDEEVVNFLNKTVSHVYDTLDPFTEQTLELDVRADDEHFILTFTLTGLWSADAFTEEGLTQCSVQTIEQTNSSWRFRLSANRE
ncbi:Spo0B domain-containing protein [Lysinibacillus piscis]|uniref:SpoOB alpha-helical domain-containing protein n=1 Tax=Lysinibacillus piscis TaxID=2518931 RepID=A0ABQ5NJG4_9BACI|nr:Spo0B domain-containing protein [Lysinibacillus sp. KH24]GLC88442.1 hypothetical protein LYSBPC_15690 [Lysinibacillus sp. KH24]